jgi:hypothetical protein
VAIHWVAVIPQFDGHPITAEQVDQVPQFPLGRGWPVPQKSSRDGALTAGGQYPHTPGRVICQLLHREPSRILGPGHLAAAKGGAEPGVPGRAIGQQ